MQSQTCYLVVAWDGDVHVAQGRVCVTQSNGGQVNVRGFCEGLVVSPGIGNHQKPWLPEGGLDLVSEGSWSEAASDRSGSSGGRELQHSSLEKQRKELTSAPETVPQEPRNDTWSAKFAMPPSWPSSRQLPQILPQNI